MSVLVAFALGWIASFLASAMYSWGRRPSIDIIAEADPARNTGQRSGLAKHRFFHLLVQNKPAHYPWHWFTNRDTAWACEVRLEFYHADRPNEKAIPDTILARWSATPELLQPVMLADASGTSRYTTIPDLSKLPYGRRLDLHSGGSEPVALVVKMEGLEQCYAFSNESYWLGWENKQWQLGTGEYKVIAEARSGRYIKAKTFRLVNRGTKLDSVRVSPWHNGDNNSTSTWWKQVRRWFVRALTSITLIAALIAILNTTVNPWMNREPYSAKDLPAENMLEIFNPHGERVDFVRVKGRVSRVIPYDIDEDGEKELLVAVTHDDSASRNDIGKLWIYEQRVFPPWKVGASYIGISKLSPEVFFDANQHTVNGKGSILGIEYFDVKRPSSLQKPIIAVVAAQQSKWDPSYLFLLDCTGKPIAQSYSHPGKLNFVHIAQTRPTYFGLPREVEDKPPKTTIYIAGWGFDMMQSHSETKESAISVVPVSVPPSQGETPKSSYGLGLLEEFNKKVFERWHILAHPKQALIDGFQFYESERDKAVDYITFWHSYNFQYLIRPEISCVAIKYIAEKPGAYPARHMICFDLCGARWEHDPLEKQPKWCDTQ